MNCELCYWVIHILIKYTILDLRWDNMRNIAAFFDIDGTIFRNSLMIEHFKKLISFEVIDPEVWYIKIKKVYDEWEKRYGDFE